MFTSTKIVNFGGGWPKICEKLLNINCKQPLVVNGGGMEGVYVVMSAICDTCLISNTGIEYLTVLLSNSV